MQRSQSPPTPRDEKATIKINTINNSAIKPLKQEILQQQQQQQPLAKNEREIQIQRVSTTNNNAEPKQQVQPLLQKSFNQPEQVNKNGSVNYIDLQVINNGVANKTISQQPIPTASTTITTTPLPTANIDLSLSNKSIKTSNSPAVPAVTSIVEINKLKQQPQQVSSPVAKPQTAPVQRVQPKVQVPQFFYPHGKPDEKQFKDDSDTMKLVSAEFRMQKDGKIFKENFAEIVKIVGLPRYWKILLFRACTVNNKLNFLTFATFEQVWTKLNSTCHDRPSLFIKLIASSGNTVVYDDWEPLMQVQLNKIFVLSQTVWH